MPKQELYQVEKIIDKEVVGRRIYYKVKWVGYPEDQCTWQTIKNLRYVKDMVDQFNKENQLKTTHLEDSSDKQIVDLIESVEQGKQRDQKLRNFGQIFQNNSSEKNSDNPQSQQTAQKSQKETSIKQKIITSSKKMKNKHKFCRVLMQESPPQSQLLKEQSKEPEKNQTQNIQRIEVNQPNLALSLFENAECGSILLNESIACKQKRTKLTKIRMLERQQGSNPNIRDYLVQDQDGKSQILNTIDLIMNYALDYVYYLQNRTSADIA